MINTFNLIFNNNIETNNFNINLNFSYKFLLSKNNYIINYKNINFLKNFLNPSGQILSRADMNISLKIYKKVVKAIKKARNLKLLPFFIEINE